MAETREAWTLDRSVTFLNHGSFGACPRAVLERQSALRAELEAEPVRFMVWELEGLWDGARARVADFVGAPEEALVFVTNATSAVNAVLRSQRFEAGDRLLVTNHGYNACKNVVDWVAARWGAEVVVAEVPFPLEDPQAVVDAVLGAVDDRTVFALLDHVTSPTGLVFPLQSLVPALEDRGVKVMVDGAHAPGMLDLDVGALGASWYTGNLHKWVCAPKGAAFLHARADRQDGLVPTVISHGLNSQRTGRPRLWTLFDWVGTDDPTAVLSVPEAIDTLAAMRPGGWPELRAECHARALVARDLLCERLEVPRPAPDEMLGTLAAIPLPDAPPDEAPHPLYLSPLQVELVEEHRIQVPIVPWPALPKRLVRISAWAYNTADEYAALADALMARLNQ